MVAILLVVAFALNRVQVSARDKGQVDLPSRIVLSVTSPVATGLGRGLDSNGRFWSAVFVSESLRRENEALRAQVAQTRLYEERISLALNQVSELRQAMGLPALQGRKRIPAEVIAYDPVSGQITLNVGDRAGVKPGQAVVTGQGYVGQVLTTEPSRSRALLVTSPLLRVGAMLNLSPPVTGLIRGRGGNRLVLEIVEAQVQVAPGQRVVTSLHSERTPAGLPIGQVLRTEAAQEFGVVRLVVIPAVNVARVKEVFVLQ